MARHAGALPSVRVRLLGEARLEFAQGAEPVALKPLDAALMALLALDGGQRRETVIRLFWPEVDDASRARNALRQRLFRLRRSAGTELIVDGELMTLAPGVGHELDNPGAVFAADPLHALPGELLGELVFEGRPALSAWLDTARARWRRQRGEALAGVCASLEAGDRLAQAIRVAERLELDEPLQEHATRRLMRLHYRRGDRAAALAAYDRLRRALEAALGESPGGETEALRRLVEQSDPTLEVAREIGPSLALTLQRPPRLVGREHACEAIASAIGRGGVAVVVGEPGVGKSRLLSELAAARGMVLAGARAGDAREPYALLRRVLAALDLPAGPAAGIDKSDRAELARCVPALGARAAGPMERERVGQALARLLALRAPAGLVVDDLQFADDASIGLLRDAMMRPPPGPGPRPGPWLMALRPAESGSTLQGWLSDLEATGVHPLVLEPLAESDAAELLGMLVPGLAPAAAARLYRHCGGSPLFMLETLRALRRTEAGAELASELPLPPSLRHLLEQRLNRLGDAALKLARVAAVAGTDFEVELAAAVLEVPALDLHGPWRELERAHVLDGLAFAHDLMFEAVRAGLPKALRAWIHGRVAAWLSQHDGAPQRLGWHWSEAGAPDRAAQAWTQAAAQAAAGGRSVEQARWLGAAADAYGLAGQAAARFDILVALAVATRESGSAAEARASAQALLDVASGDGERARALVELAACHLNEARFDAAAELLGEAITRSAQAGDHHTAQHARYLQAVASAQTLGMDEAIRRIEPLRPWAEALQDASLRHSFLADLAIVYDQADQRRRARPLFERVLAFFDQRHETSNAAPARALYARSLLMLGDPQAARRQLEMAVQDRGLAAGGGGAHGIERLNLGRVLCELGCYREALDLLVPEIDRLQGEAAAVVRGAVALVVARVQAHLGQPARAWPMLRMLPDQAPYHQRATRAWTESLLVSDRPRDHERLLAQALACFEGQADLPFLRLPMLFDRLGCAADEGVLVALRGAVAECERRELPAPQLLGRARLMQVLARLGRVEDAATVAHSLMDDLANCRPVGCYLPELWAGIQQAADAAGERGLARKALEHALAWIDEVAREQLPALGRDAFLQRNPVNRALLAAAGDGSWRAGR